MPSQFVTFRFETGYRYSTTPYWSGREGITPPGGNVAPVANNGSVGTGASYLCTNGATSAVLNFVPSAKGLYQGFGPTAGFDLPSTLSADCAAQYNPQQNGTWALWQPDLRKSQWVNTIALMVKW
jgi:hypothetical protein